uniref:Uncharacterized protein n=1 Tax=Mycena chlorophos TaxID=658473 RepID=A0ABQ0L3I7_MYCCL|nr:predicted protein [Mycena chlorophos]
MTIRQPFAQFASPPSSRAPWLRRQHLCGDSIPVLSPDVSFHQMRREATGFASPPSRALSPRIVDLLVFSLREFCFQALEKRRAQQRLWSPVEVRLLRPCTISPPSHHFRSSRRLESTISSLSAPATRSFASPPSCAPRSRIADCMGGSLLELASTCQLGLTDISRGRPAFSSFPVLLRRLCPAASGAVPGLGDLREQLRVADVGATSAIRHASSHQSRRAAELPRVLCSDVVSPLGPDSAVRQRASPTRPDFASAAHQRAIIVIRCFFAAGGQQTHRLKRRTCRTGFGHETHPAEESLSRSKQRISPPSLPSDAPSSRYAYFDLILAPRSLEFSKGLPAGGKQTGGLNATGWMVLCALVDT